MKEIELKYGCNPNQKPARIFVPQGELPLRVLNGKPGYINFLDALNGWQLVTELKEATGYAAAASFKHVSPAGAAIGLPLPDILRKTYFVDDSLTLSPLACAYARARGADRLSCYGDWVALSDCCDISTAKLLQHEVSDGVVAPGYTEDALALLKSKRGGSYNIVQIDPAYIPAPLEHKDVFGITFEQRRNSFIIDQSALQNLPTQNKYLSPEQKQDLLIALVVLKYTQSNSVCYVKNGQAIGIGAGQQSRIHCTRLAGNKADIWHLRQHPKTQALDFLDTLGRAERDNVIDVYLSEDCADVASEETWAHFFKTRPAPLTAQERAAWLAAVTDVALGSDAFFPFGDNIQRAHRSGVTAIVQPGGSIRDDHVIQTCDAYGITMAFSGIRLFHH